MSRANRKREPEQWPRVVNLGLGVVLAGVVAYQLFAPAVHAPRGPGAPNLAKAGDPALNPIIGPGEPTSPLPNGTRDPFTPLPPGTDPATATATTSGTPAAPATGSASASAGSGGAATGGTSRSGGSSEEIWVPPSLRSLPSVTAIPGGAPGSETAFPPSTELPPTPPASSDSDSDEEMVMMPTRLLEAQGGKSRSARFQYGGEVLTRRQGDYLGTYRVERVDHDAIILIDSRKRRVRLLTGQSVNGTPSASSTVASSPPRPVRTVVPRTPRVAVAPTPPASPPSNPPTTPRPRPASPPDGERPVQIEAPLPTVKGAEKERQTEPPVTKPQVTTTPPPTVPSRPTVAQPTRPARTETPMPPTEGPLPLTRK